MHARGDLSADIVERRQGEGGGGGEARLHVNGVFLWHAVFLHHHTLQVPELELPDVAQLALRMRSI
jgi:hypothetical protein